MIYYMYKYYQDKNETLNYTKEQNMELGTVKKMYRW